MFKRTSKPAARSSKRLKIRSNIKAGFAPGGNIRNPGS